MQSSKPDIFAKFVVGILGTLGVNLGTVAFQIGPQGSVKNVLNLENKFYASNQISWKPLRVSSTVF